MVTLATAALAETPQYDDENTPQGWAWARIRNDEPADFNQKYGTLDVNKNNTEADNNRRIPANALVDWLTNPAVQDQIKSHKVQLEGVIIDEPIDLSDREIIPSLEIKVSRIEQGLQFT